MSRLRIAPRLAVLALCVLPSIADAQRRAMGGSKEADWNAIAEKSAPAGPTISAKDFEKVSPFKALLDKKKDLKLTDAQLAAFNTANTTLLAANADRFKLLDSLKKEAKPKTSGDPSAEDEARLVIAREGLQGVVRDIRASYDEAAKNVEGLDDAQKATATSVLAKNTEQMQEMLRDKMGGRGGAPGGGGRGRPPV
jgi:hypothetical protein